MKKNSPRTLPLRRNLVLRRETITLLTGAQLVQVTAGVKQAGFTDGDYWPCQVSPVNE